MASPGSGSGSPLAHVAARRRAVQRTRQSLGVGASAPNARVQPASPPPPTPAAEDPAARLPQTEFSPPAGSDPNSREAMLSQAQQFLNQVAQGGQQVAPQPEAIATPAPTEPVAPLADRLTSLGAARSPMDVQFMRLAGRPPSARELAVFAAYSQLSQEMGRPPTRRELLYRVTRRSSEPGMAGIEPVVAP